MKLIYRGQTFNFQAAPAAPSIKTTSTLIRILIYRGNTYLFKPAVACPTRLPRMINWRYSLPCEAVQGQLTPAH